MNKPVVLIRTDGSNEIGLGHIYRSKSLANEFKLHGYSVHFITSHNFNVLLKNSGKCHITKPTMKNEIELIRKIKPQLFVLDILDKFFPYGGQYFLQIQKICNTLTAIDYASKNLKYFDLSFHSLFGPKNFKAKNTFHNLKYSIVSNVFKKESHNFKVKKDSLSIIVLCGGADTNCFCPKIIRSLNNLDPKIKISLVLGKKFACWTQLKKEKKNLKREIEIFHNVKNLENLMKKHQLAITAAGVTMTELLTIGIPSLIIYGDSHEKEAAKLIHKNNVAINVGFGKTISEKKILQNVNELILDYQKRKYLNKNSKLIFDGNGTKRVVSKILSNEKLDN